MIRWYVDPGQGFIFSQGTSFLWALMLALAGGVLFFFRSFFLFFRKGGKWIFFLAAALLFAGGMLMTRKAARAPRVVILAVDGMDPAITEKLMGEGRLPAFSRLRSRGSYSPLATTVPPESVVAWSSFVTGLAPGEHGIFDFVMRDPARRSLYLSLDEVVPGKGCVRRRKGETLWHCLSRQNVRCRVYFCPDSFPPEKVRGVMLSGMGVPDIAGLMGRHTFYTELPFSSGSAESRGRVVGVSMVDGRARSRLYGPKRAGRRGLSETSVPFDIEAKAADEIVLDFKGRKYGLREGSWSGWIPVDFRDGLFFRARGIVEFYLKSVSPLELYAGPVNFDPRRPPFAISYPAAYSRRLAAGAGLFHTQGMPSDTFSLSEGRISEEAFLEHLDEIFGERERILDRGLEEFSSGVFFFYLETLDSVQHMFWDSPGTVYRYYEKIDGLLGKLMKRIGDDTTLIVLSDHGFGPFRRSVHLNRWLMDNGFLALLPGEEGVNVFLEGIDWQRTKAYAAGFGGIYLNRKGREPGGILDGPAVRETVGAIRDGLLRLRDPDSGARVVRSVYLKEDVFAGACDGDAPDLYAGFDSGYRASWQTALGGAGPAVIEENRKKWGGDHLVDPPLVPGVLFISSKEDLGRPSITDIAPTVVSLCGGRVPEKMRGKDLTARAPR